MSLDRGIVLILIAALLGGLGGYWASRATFQVDRYSTPPDAARKPGDPAPELRARARDGREVALAELRGRRVLINFWATWCPPCVEELPLLDRVRAELGGAELEVIAVAVEDPAAVEQFLARHPLGLPVWIIDPAQSSEPSLAFGNARRVLPYSVLIERDGRLLKQKAGAFDEPTLRRWLAPDGP